MLLLRRPSPDRIDRFLAAQRALPLTYPQVGASRTGGGPPGFRRDHNRVRLGEGRDCFERAKEAVRSWAMFDLPWGGVHPAGTPLEPGATVAVGFRHFGFWSLHACRIVYTLDEQGPVERFGFAYGTLPGHDERGEERFSVEWRHEDGSVWYDIAAFSRPRNLLVWLGYPLARRLQKRFVRDSQRAMRRALLKR